MSWSLLNTVDYVQRKSLTLMSMNACGRECLQMPHAHDWYNEELNDKSLL